MARSNGNPICSVPLSFTFVALHVVLPVFTGAAIYTLWRSKLLLVFAWYRCVGLYEPVLLLRSHVDNAKHLIPSPILYSLPDGLWVYSFTALLRYIWRQQPEGPSRHIWSLLPVTMAVCAEVGQRFRLVPGTFDWMDMALYVAAWLLAIFSARVFLRPSPSQTLNEVMIG